MIEHKKAREKKKKKSPQAMTGIERLVSTKAAKQMCESRRANKTKEILHRDAACPNPSMLSYTKIKS